MSYIGQDLGQGQAERFIFTATAVTDTVTADSDGRTIGYTIGQCSIFLNGVKQVIGVDVGVGGMNGSTVVFAEDFAIGDVIEVIALSAFSPSDTVSASTGGTFSGAVTASAGFTANTADINGGTIDGSTITSPVINTGVSGTAVLDSDTMSGASATTISSSESIKAYVDSAATQATTAAQGVGTGNSPSFGALTLSTGSLVIGTAGQGITFSSTNTPAQIAGTGTSNTLNDYEEGTWTGTLRGNSANPSTAMTATGYYTKTGNVVNISIAFDNINTTGHSGYVSIIGLPFTSSSLNYTRFPLTSVMYNGFTWDADRNPVSIIHTNYSNIEFFQMKANTSWTTLVHNPTSGVYLWVNGHYLV